ncbi:MAG: ribosomal RNA small subunit methyltransferase A, partial [Mailhella sp.]
IQKEVGERLLASPGTKNYGALSVWIQSFAAVRKGFVIGPAAFSPPPKVDSMVVVFEPLSPEMQPKDPASLARCIKLCFQQRRKQLQGILRRALPSSFTPGMLSELGISPAQRPETLSVMEFQRLSAMLFSEKIFPESPAALDDEQETCS